MLVPAVWGEEEIGGVLRCRWGVVILRRGGGGGGGGLVQLELGYRWCGFGGAMFGYVGWAFWKGGALSWDGWRGDLVCGAVISSRGTFR